MTQSDESLSVLAPMLATLLDILAEIPAEEAGLGPEDLPVPNLTERYANQVADIGAAGMEAGYMGLYDVCTLFQGMLEAWGGHARDLSAGERELLEEWPVRVMSYLESPSDPETTQALVEHLQNPAWSSPLAEEDAEALKGLFSLPPAEEEVPQQIVEGEQATEAIPGSSGAQATGAESSAEKDAEGEHAPISSPHPLDEASEETLAILRLAVTQIADLLDESLAGIATEHVAPEARQQVLEGYTEELGRLGEAAEVVGLEGLHQVCAHLQDNLRTFIDQARVIGASEKAVLAGWPAQMLGYLQALHDREACESLIRSLQAPQWPKPLPHPEARALIERLVAANVKLEEQVEPRQQHAALEDVSLTLPENVDPELLESLLQELPQQTADFSASIQRLTDGVGTLDDVVTAQRIAHTVKGAANTVGIRGIANLTHPIEDILLALDKHQALPNPALSETLIKAADMLETVSESLLGLSEAPPEAEETRGVLQEVLDWANRIDQQGIPSEGERLPPREGTPAPLAQGDEAAATQAGVAWDPEKPAASPQALATEPTTPTRMLRIPAALVDNLLRLTGETIILNTQLRDRLQRVQRQTKTLHQQHLFLQQLSAELEQLVDIQGITSTVTQSELREGGFDPLEMDQYNELHTVTHRLLEAGTDAREMTQNVETHLTALDGLLTDQARLHGETEKTVMYTRMVPIKTVISRLQRSVRQTCRLTHKDVELHIAGEETPLDSNVLNELVDPLMHVLRNAVDHGIEGPEARAAAGKPTTGTIHLSFAREGTHAVVRCQDDGAGLDYAGIRHAAEQRGLIRPDQESTEEALTRLVLTPGFSTRAEATQVSGRGIGLDAVRSRLLDLKGTLHIRSRTGQGCLVEMRLPVTLMSTHGLLVRTASQVFAISDRGVEQILYTPYGTLGKVGTQLTYQMEDEVFEATTLESLLNLPPDRRREDRAPRPALKVADGSGGTQVVLVQEVLDSRELVVKGMGQYIPKLSGVTGATILGDGSVAAVLDLPEVIRVAAGPTLVTPVAPEQPAPRVSAGTAPCALVVDDSLSARRALAQFAKDAGFEVRTAQDGLEAVAIIDARQPDILLVDMEMPRMNGLELTAHVRGSEATKHLPIIMITSRSTEKHRREAQSAGVDVYLTKPYAEDELLEHIQQLTALRGAA
jgi:chemotaxis protein histidine kinase CheA/ActR/RegA family two-component response regulator